MVGIPEAQPVVKTGLEDLDRSSDFLTVRETYWGMDLSDFRELAPLRRLPGRAFVVWSCLLKYVRDQRWVNDYLHD